MKKKTDPYQSEIVHRVRYLLFACVFFAFLTFSACQNLPPSEESLSPKVISSHQYTVNQRLGLVNQGSGKPEKQNLWVALIRDISPYQKVSSRNITPAGYQLVIDEYGNEYAEFDFSDHPAGTEISVEIEYQVEVYELQYEFGSCEGISPNEFTQPELNIESGNPQIIAIAEDLSLETKNPCEQVRAFYDFVVDELVYRYNRNDWGAQAALGPMGADCTEYSSLTIALSRAAGIPARYYEGLLYRDEEIAELAQTEHAWMDVYLPGVGWTAIDPTLGRESVFRETYFAHYTPDHIIVTTGRNPSTLRGSNYWSHLYWPGDSTDIQLNIADWDIILIE
jgi:transglutaminase-like putative cysteine protease